MSTVSIIITTYKAVSHLRCLTESLLRASGAADIEVALYGDGGGSDSEQAIAECGRRLLQAGYHVQQHYCPTNKGIVPALNAACRMATAPWLLVVNDDMVFSSNWFSEIKPHLKAKRVLSLVAAEPPLPGRNVASCFHAHNMGLNPEAFDFSALDAFAQKTKSVELETGVNYPFLVERAEFWRIGGADERFVGPYHDPDLFHRFALAGLELLRLKSCIFYHFSGISLRFSSPEETNNALAKLNKKSLNWIVRENHARLEFIRKWGAKPKARFGFIPKVAATEPWEGRPHSILEQTRFALLLAWEKTRCVVREWTARY